MGQCDRLTCLLPVVLQACMWWTGAAAAVTAAPAAAEDEPAVVRDWSLVHVFKSRPDLPTPKWDVTIYDQDALSPGYIFVAPYEKIGQHDPGDGWIGPQIYDQQGDLIWNGADLFGNMSVQDFRVSKYRGEDRLTMIMPAPRHGAVLNNHYEFEVDVPIHMFNMHEFNFVDNGDRALVIQGHIQKSSREDAIATGLAEGLCTANFYDIVEYDTHTWEPTFLWPSIGHVWLNESTMFVADGPAEDRCHREWDFMHVNAVDKCPDGDIIISARQTDAIYKISRKTNEIVWRLGGRANDFEMVDNLNFSRQHDVRCRAQNSTHTIITFLDNAKGEDERLPTSEHSRGLRLALNNETMQAVILDHYDIPEDGPRKYAHRRGTFQQLPNNHIIMGWSERGHLTEHSPDGRVLMDMTMQLDWMGTYRSYKFDFVGKPRQPPDVYARAVKDDGKTNTVVYVSWNGATEVAEWRLFKSNGKKTGPDVQELETKRKTGFETGFTYDGQLNYVVLEALDARGKPIGRSNAVHVPRPEKMTDDDEQLIEEIAQQEELYHVDSDDNDDSDSDSSLTSKFNLGEHLQDPGSFLQGFIFAASLIGAVFLVRYLMKRNGSKWLRVRLPWHQQQAYAALSDDDEAKWPLTDEHND